MEVNGVNALADALAGQAKTAPAPHVRAAAPAPAAVASPPPRPPANEEQVQRAVRDASEPPRILSAPSRLRIDESTGRFVVQILDENDQVVRQIPPEELLRIAQRFKQLQGLLFDEQS
ncbi:MAG: flagellar protein FlaG [Candidatus Hydrogenedentes bacterium]|nr:flagellar protein FlaG [Candidatus Hydrogenedentota bacterium]MBI3119773.1 flagellar protein FlaG [Candidatus Hydrogenedentota bacterium]